MLPAWQRYVDWLAGNDWRAEGEVGYPLVTVRNPSTNEAGWWADVDGELTRWEMEEGELYALVRQPDGSDRTHRGRRRLGRPTKRAPRSSGASIPTIGRSCGCAVRAKRSGFAPRPASAKRATAHARYIPLRKGLLRLDAGTSLETGRPVAVTLFPRVRNTLILAGLAFLIVMPLALLLGVIAGINEGRFIDRLISITGLAFTATPEFVTGIFLILIFGVWLMAFPAVAIFTSPNAIFENPKLLVLPVMTLTAVELGYVARMTRASMVEVMDSAYIRTAVIKGMPRRRIVLRHALRNALLAPITIIMLHVNWLIGGVVVVEAIFGYPGVGQLHLWRGHLWRSQRGGGGSHAAGHHRRGHASSRRPGLYAAQSEDSLCVTWNGGRT